MTIKISRGTEEEAGSQMLITIEILLEVLGQSQDPRKIYGLLLNPESAEQPLIIERAI